MAVLGVAKKGTNTFAPPFAGQLNLAYHDAMGAQYARQLLLGRQHLVLFQFIVCHAECFQHLPQGGSVVLRLSLVSALEAQPALASGQCLVQLSLFQPAAFLYLVKVYWHTSWSLVVHQFTVEAFLRHQVIVGAALHNASLVHDDDFVAVADG